jgi:hypothetical protein
MTTRKTWLPLLFVAGVALTGSTGPAYNIPYDRLAARIVTALRLNLASACCFATIRRRSDRSSQRSERR